MAGIQSIGFFRLFFLFNFLLFFATTEVNAQNLDILKKRKAQNEKDIAYINALISNVLSDQENSLNRLVILNKKIKSRESLIHSIESEVALLDSHIEGLQQEILNLEALLKKLKEYYAQSIYYAYKHRGSSEKLMFLFSSRDFNQAYKRFKYLQQFMESIRNQGYEIISLRDSLDARTALLKNTYQEKKELLLQNATEKRLLSRENSEQEQRITKLKKKETKLRNDLAKQQRYARNLEKEIQRIIKEEAKLASGRRQKGTEKFVLTPNEQLLSNNFITNKGKLPWPTRTGFISERFGEHPHPVLKYVKVRNDGINITTDPNSDCRSVFRGVVSHILSLPGLNAVVIIRHGDFFSVYSNLIDLSIKKGDFVDTKQRIGAVFTDTKEGTAVLKFQLWKGSAKLDPTLWLNRN